MSKICCAIVGSGNIGTDLIYKLRRSAVLEPVWMVGIDPGSEGLKRARDLGLKTTNKGVDGLVPHAKADGIRIAFDATSAYVHAQNATKLNEVGVMMIDLTPAAIGPYCCPPVNLREQLGKGINLAAEFPANPFSSGCAIIRSMRRYWHCRSMWKTSMKRPCSMSRSGLRVHPIILWRNKRR